MNSSDMNITYRAIIERAEDDARDRMPDMPNENTVEAWEAFVSDLESLDVMDIAHESSEWDWVIYYHRAMELCQAVPSDVLSDAEDQWQDMGAYVDDSFTLHGFACTLAAIIVESEIMQAVERIRDELIELAENQLENM